MPGGRPPKPLHLVQGHRTKAEKQVREKGESELLTGTHLKESPEVKKNPIAHKEFTRVKKLLKSIGKDDDLYGHIINLHCLIHAECKEIEVFKETLMKNLEEFDEKCEDEEIDFATKMEIKVKMQKQILDCGKALKDKRKMLIDISKENIMTIQSALRSVPKKPEDSKKSKMSSFLQKRGVGNGS
ncbi:hypothetical protein AM500_21430 [Bacillus sp. FJAT-18017]|uniref:hypothetical protein n=1 Tax=Bacillus sp. FJAT-18017 TaxID=1705566 RepID=UPI0006AE1AED|nr:hypothetical protein [Bacillus sp. FJAT-18017]ALC92068.1 hypothetical protein AM500_21430 [Bacillus sp. FJAT-18017]